MGNIVPVIMCGGTGSRLWPMSRESFPKQFLAVKKGTKNSLLQNTIKRITKFEDIEKPVLICNEEHRFIVLNQLKEVDVDPDSIILEPCGKNTAPAIAIAALNIEINHPEKNLLVLSADHDIKDEAKFFECLRTANNYSNKGLLVTFGIVPTKPETGFGYIEVAEKFNINSNEGYLIRSFLEKPDKKKAAELVSNGMYLWNSGMFMFKTKAIIDEIEKYNPELIKCCSEALKKSKRDLSFTRLDKEEFSKCQNISIDVAVMEKTESSLVIPCDIGWSDIGSWRALWELEEKDKNNNVSLGRVMLSDVKDSYIRSNERLVVGLGIDNLTIIETNDAILISNKQLDQEVKNITRKLNKNNYVEGSEHKRGFRPWGNYLKLAEEDNWKVKKIVVEVGASLSLQLHKQRSEHWVVVKGSALVEINERKFSLNENQSTYIPKGSKHRLSNNGNVPLILIEIQSGDYLGEDDIVRFKDNYGR